MRHIVRFQGLPSLLSSLSSPRPIYLFLAFHDLPMAVSFRTDLSSQLCPIHLQWHSSISKSQLLLGLTYQKCDSSDQLFALVNHATVGPECCGHCILCLGGEMIPFTFTSNFILSTYLLVVYHILILVHAHYDSVHLQKHLSERMEPSFPSLMILTSGMSPLW